MGTIENPATFTVGSSAGNGGASTFYGDVTIGGSGNTVTTQIYGDFAQGGTGSTFSTGDGAISLNGDVTIAAEKDFEMTLGGGTPGTFATAEGAVALNGDVTIANSKTL